MSICNATNVQRIFLVAIVAFVLGHLLRQTFAADKPNIIYILADDLGYGDVGCYGQQRIKTPRLDRMAAEGMRFTDHYSGSTVCAPSRCSLMTGYHTGHTYIRGNNEVKPEGQKPHDYLFWIYTGTRTVRKGDWKAIGWPPRFKLFNLKTDPGETKDVYEEHPDVVAQIREIMEQAYTKP